MGNHIPERVRDPMCAKGSETENGVKMTFRAKDEVGYLGEGRSFAG